MIMAEYISNFSHWTWWILGVILVVVEIAAPGTFFLWMGISAGVVGVALYFSPSLPWEAQLTIFALFSVISIFVSRFFFQKESKEESTLSQRGKRYLGSMVTVEEPIENGVGKVRVEDTVWRASGEDAPAGSQVRIVGIDGATFKVEAPKQPGLSTGEREGDLGGS